MKYAQRIIYQDDEYVVQFRKRGLFQRWNNHPYRFRNYQDAKNYKDHGIVANEYSMEVGKALWKL